MDLWDANLPDLTWFGHHSCVFAQCGANIFRTTPRRCQACMEKPEWIRHTQLLGLHFALSRFFPQSIHLSFMDVFFLSDSSVYRLEKC